MKQDQKIPKIIHYCWFGGKPIPKKTLEYIETWSRFCSNYEIKEWNEKNFDVNKYSYAKEAYEAKKWAFVADVCRLEKVYEFGGIYLDVNTEILQNIDQFLADEMFIGFEQGNYIAPSVFGAKKRHPLIKRVLNIYNEERLLNEKGEINFATINNRLQPIFLDIGMKADNTYQKLDGVTIYPKKYFQPRYWNSPNQDPLTKDTYTIHYFGASWHDKETKEWLNFTTSQEAPLVSIIIPVYNVEQYLAECLDSIFAQSYTNLEIIIVDDKSPDKSGKIADEYAQKDERIKVIHKPKNEGLNMARATGFKQSTGGFVTFVDSDDKILPGYIEKLVKVQRKTDADITMCGYIFYDAELKNPLPIQPIQQYPLKTKPDTYTQDEMISYYLTQWTYWRHNNNTTNTCCKLFARSILEKLDWRETDYSIGEDDFETLYTFSYAQKYTVVNDQMYLYRANPNSLSNSKIFTPKYRGRAVSAFEICRDFEVKALEILGQGYEDGIYYRVHSIYQYYIGLLLNKNSLGSDDVAIFDKYFPAKKIRRVKKYSIDKNMLDLVERGGLARYLTVWLWADSLAKQSHIAHLESSLAVKDAELSSYLSIKRSARLLAGNIKRRVKKKRYKL